MNPRGGTKTWRHCFCASWPIRCPRPSSRTAFAEGQTRARDFPDPCAAGCTQAAGHLYKPPLPVKPQILIDVYAR